MNIRRFNESETTEDQQMAFDIKSLEVDKDLIGFKRDVEEISKKDEKKLKQDIQITTPGLDKSIKKFEDFKVSISIDEIEPEGDGLESNDIATDVLGVNSDCCSKCECDPCECAPVDKNVDDIIGFEDFLKDII